ncbi:hypothetical protein HMPREF9554_00643 [Treponema phagedenis F0421]|nr:hypothetical protein HMPREF9554_00643 [Treponema phagedenis F0421]
MFCLMLQRKQAKLASFPSFPSETPLLPSTTAYGSTRRTRRGTNAYILFIVQTVFSNV